MKLVAVENRRVDRVSSGRDTGEAIERVGKYQVVRLLAVGGMAQIYLARETGLCERLVVIKRVLPQFEADAEFVRMFLDEARLAVTLQHPNIVQVFAVDEHEGQHFLAMEYLHGHDLGRVLTRASAAKKRLPLEHALAIIHGAAAGLHHAHDSRGLDGAPNCIVHRDVSPGNIVITFDGHVKLVDFGIAKAVARASKTADGVVKGKVSYMSPEQCCGKPLDRRSDIFSLGIVMWELTTGRKLFKGASEYVIANQLLNEEIPRPSTHVPNYPPPLEALVMRMLSRDPDERPPTSQEVQSTIEQIARDRRLTLSPIGLAAYMRELFGEDRSAWDEIAVEPEPPRVPASVRPTLPERPGAKPRRSRWWIAAPIALVVIAAGGWALHAQLAESPSIAAPAPTANVPPPAQPIVEAPPTVAAPPTPAPVVEEPPVVVEKPRPRTKTKREPAKKEPITAPPVDPDAERKAREEAEKREKLEKRYFGEPAKKETTP